MGGLVGFGVTHRLLRTKLWFGRRIGRVDQRHCRREARRPLSKSTVSDRNLDWMAFWRTVFRGLWLGWR